MRQYYILFSILFLFSFGLVSQDLPTFIAVEGGTFTMGDEWGLGEDDDSTHIVTLTTFKISSTEISVSQYRAYCKATGKSMPDAPSWGWQENNPMVNVSWQNAIDYSQWLSKKLQKKIRLPYEAEWEYAARGGSKSQGNKYSGAQKIANTGCWYNANSDGKTQNVATKKPNELGLFDMSGNVWEWCMDNYGKDYYENSASTNPQGPSSGDNKVMRGGSWNYHGNGCRVAYRFKCKASCSYDDIGFRVVSN